MSNQSLLTPEVLVTRLGEYLVEKGLLSAQDLKRALDHQESLRGRREEDPPLIGQILLEMELVDRPTLDAAITEQILQLRSALQQANQQLEQRVKERTAELERALAKLSELNKLKSNFVANISHELRTPLTHLKGYLELLLSQDLGKLEKDQIQAMNVMVRSTDRLERLIEDLIMFSIMERGEFEMRIQPFNFSDLCQGVTTGSVTRAQERSIQLLIDCTSDLPQVMADQEKIQYAVQQLIDNAIKFTPSGGSVTLKAEREEKLVRVSVIDTGIGIAPEQVEEIFEPFHQLDGSSTRKFAGTGLGLALVRKILEAHGTVLHVNSQPGQGSHFAFILSTTEVLNNQQGFEEKRTIDWSL
jgi:signal transduction histidine kinase